MELDVDDTESYGPETITVTHASEGIYRYYVHNYTDRSDSYSTRLALSGATVQVYNGNMLMYTIHVPTDKDGTLWHVFDYDTSVGKIRLDNSFSYESSASSIGGVIVTASEEERKIADEKQPKNSDVVAEGELVDFFSDSDGTDNIEESTQTTVDSIDVINKAVKEEKSEIDSVLEVA